MTSAGDRRLTGEGEGGMAEEMLAPNGGAGAGGAGGARGGGGAGDDRGDGDGVDCSGNRGGDGRGSDRPCSLLTLKTTGSYCWRLAGVLAQVAALNGDRAGSRTEGRGACAQNVESYTILCTNLFSDLSSRPN